MKFIIVFTLCLNVFAQGQNIPKINEFIGDVRSIITQKNNDLFTNFILQNSPGSFDFISSKRVRCHRSQVARNVKVASINYVKNESTFLIEYLGCNNIAMYSEEVTLAPDKVATNDIKAILTGNLDYINEPITSYTLTLQGNSQILRYKKNAGKEIVSINGEVFLLSLRKTDLFTYQFSPFSTSFEGYNYRFGFKAFDLSVKGERYFKGAEEIPLLEFNKSYGSLISETNKSIYSRVLKDFQRRFPQTEIAKPVGNNKFLEDLQLIRRRLEQGTPDQIQLLRVQVLQLIQDYQNGKLQIIDNRSE